jgi:hypothetical protein
MTKHLQHLALRTAHIAASWALTLSVYSPERTETEPGKREGKADGDGNTAGGRAARRILRIFTNESDSTEGSHRKKNGAGYLKPQKMKDVAEGPRGRANRGHGGI